MDWWIRKVSSYVALGLSATSVVTGVAVGIYQGAWVPLLFCVLPFALFFAGIVLVRLQSARMLAPPLRAAPETDQLAHDMLATSVRPYLYPVCGGKRGTFVCGRTAAALAAFHLKAVITHLRMQFDNRKDEVNRETTYTPEKLLRHLGNSRALQATLNGHLQSLAVQCAQLCEQTRPIYELLERLREDLEEYIVQPMQILLKGVSDWDVPDPRIETLLHSTVSDFLKRVEAQQLRQLEAESDGAIEKLRKEWHAGVQDIWSDSWCRPKQEPPPEMPSTIKAFLKKIA